LQGLDFGQHGGGDKATPIYSLGAVQFVSLNHEPRVKTVNPKP